MLILTEKPSVAKAFADALGVPRKDKFWENGAYCIVNALGHLLEDYLPEDYDPALKKWEIEGLPIIPDAVKCKPVEKTKDQLAVVKKCFDAHKNDPLLLATDAEREGELIGAEILDYAGFKNYSNARRFWVSEALTPEVVKAGIENAKPLSEYSSYREQGFARQHADWLIGMNLTRLVSLKTGKLLHFGRVQTALLGAIHEREKSIANFAPEKFFEVKAVLEGASPFSVKLVNPDNDEFPARFESDSKLLAEIKAEKDFLTTGVITEIEKEKKTVQPPQLFNLTALQKEAHKQYSYSPEQTLEIAQALYEKHKCLSYPRTPSRVMGDENVALVKSIYDKLVSSSTYVGKVYLGKGPGGMPMDGADPALISADNKRLFNSAELQDHHALIPLTPLPLDCSDEEKNIYFLVFERFFTILKPPYVYNSVKIAASVFSDKKRFMFKGTGVEILQTGWKTAHNADDDEEEEEDYAGLEKDKEYPVSSVEIEEKKTAPKKHYTFASILQLMENPRGEDGKRLTGLGTPATRGAILQKLVDRKYVSLKGKNILITDDGKFLIENVLKNEGLAAFISIPETTRWEEQLHEDTAMFIEGIKDFVRSAVKNTGMDAYRREKASLGKCPLCGAAVYEGKKNYYCSNYKGEKPCNFAIWKEICGAAVSPDEAQAMLAGKKTKMKKCVSKKTGKEFKAAFFLSGDKILMQFEEKKK
jgi:DNA topoisomerase-3